ncbi:chloride channel protein [Anaerotignum sp.]|nr:chloride channel protein [Anaerotignum sp.]
MIKRFYRKYEDKFNRSEDNLLHFASWMCAGLCIGFVVGLVGVAFHLMLEWATEFRTEHPMLIWLLPLGGLAIVLAYRLAGMEKDRGTNFILVAVRSNEAVTIKTAPLIFFSTVVTHLLGGSAGREGAALQLGGSIASSFGRTMELDEKEERIMTMCGMAAGFSALFGTPLTSVVFAMEVITVGVMHYSAIVPCTVAALVASSMSQAMGIAPTAFTVADIPTKIAMETGWSVGLLGILCALLSILFCVVMEHTGHAYRERIKNPMVRVFVGGCIIIALTYLVGCRDYNGAGMDIIIKALNGDAKAEAFLLKILFTSLTLGAGFKGGEIVPSFFIGATFGCIAGPLLGLPATFAASLGMAAVFCGVTNCPLASIILCIELFGFKGTGYYALCCGISYMLSGYYGLYSEQKIMYSKVQPEFINKNVH